VVIDSIPSSLAHDRLTVEQTCDKIISSTMFAVCKRATTGSIPPQGVLVFACHHYKTRKARCVLRLSQVKRVPCYY
jgi:hypothetical protein